MWPIIVYRPKKLSCHGRCGLLTSSLVLLEIETGYMFVENYASTYALMIFGLSAFKFYEWPNVNSIVGHQIDPGHNIDIDLVSLMPWRLHFVGKISKQLSVY